MKTIADFSKVFHKSSLKSNLSKLREVKIYCDGWACFLVMSCLMAGEVANNAQQLSDSMLSRFRALKLMARPSDDYFLGLKIYGAREISGKNLLAEI